jgi:hypothetical protein
MTCATRGIRGRPATGADLHELMERMGHGSTRAALIYIHAAKEGDRSVIAGIDRYLSGSTDDEGPDREAKP